MSARLVIEAPPTHVLARRFFEHACAILGGYLQPLGAGKYAITDPVGMAKALEAYAKGLPDLWMTGNDKKIFNKLCSSLGTSGGLREVVKAYAEALARGSVPSTTFSALSLLKVTLYEHSRGFGSSKAERVSLDVHQTVLSLFGAATAKVGRLTLGAQPGTLYLVAIPGTALGTYLEVRDELRRASELCRKLDIPEAVKQLAVARAALRCRDFCDRYAEELVIMEAGNRATLFRRAELTTGGLVHAFSELKEELQSQLVEALRIVLESYFVTMNWDEAAPYTHAVEKVAEALVAYVSTGSRDYQYLAVSTIERLLASEAETVAKVAKAYASVLGKRGKAVEEPANLFKSLRVLARAVASIKSPVLVYVY